MRSICEADPSKADLNVLHRAFANRVRATPTSGNPPLTTLRRRFVLNMTETCEPMLDPTLPRVRANSLKPVIDDLRLRRRPQAYRAMEAAGHFGKIVIRM